MSAIAENNLNSVFFVQHADGDMYVLAKSYAEAEAKWENYQRDVMDMLASDIDPPSSISKLCDETQVIP